MNGEQQARRGKRPRPPLDPATLRALALHYVGKYATTQGKLCAYLGRKVKERGWVEGTPLPDLQALAEEFQGRGYVDDEGYASAKTNSLLRRGYGAARVRMALRTAGIAAETVSRHADLDIESAEQSALSFARRKRLGPFGNTPIDHKAQSRALAAFIRAGHSYEIARKILGIPPESAD